MGAAHFLAERSGGLAALGHQLAHPARLGSQGFPSFVTASEGRSKVVEIAPTVAWVTFTCVDFSVDHAVKLVNKRGLQRSTVTHSEHFLSRNRASTVKNNVLVYKAGNSGIRKGLCDMLASTRGTDEKSDIDRQSRSKADEPC